jgi:hypothetical protein
MQAVVGTSGSPRGCNRLSLGTNQRNNMIGADAGCSWYQWFSKGLQQALAWYQPEQRGYPEWMQAVVGSSGGSPSSCRPSLVRTGTNWISRLAQPLGKLQAAECLVTTLRNSDWAPHRNHMAVGSHKEFLSARTNHLCTLIRSVVPPIEILLAWVTCKQIEECMNCSLVPAGTYWIFRAAQPLGKCLVTAL